MFRTKQDAFKDSYKNVTSKTQPNVILVKGGLFGDNNLWV